MGAFSHGTQRKNSSEMPNTAISGCMATAKVIHKAVSNLRRRNAAATLSKIPAAAGARGWRYWSTG